ncbi:MAG: hypothetical protein AAFX87_14860 [Bacteroidota bacterium]
MKIKLKKFSEFAKDILPHEASYLLRVNHFQDEDNRKILERLAYNANHITEHVPYDTTIDKRKYSNLMRWIENKFRDADVDYNFEWINENDRKVMADAITPEEEKELIKAVRNYKPHSYYFIKFYELLENFRHFLLIRLRLEEHKIISDFVDSYRSEYERCTAVSRKLHEATLDIIEQYSTNSRESRHWENWLREVFYDDTLDGRNRYFAVVRLTFMYFNYREFDKLKAIYDDLDKMFDKGTFYSKRILLNYYANRVLLHSKFDVLQQAEDYGYLSIKQKNADYLHYLNNFCAILLRQGKVDEALSLMRESFSEMRNSSNFHNKIGFVSFYIKCLVENGQPKEAEQYAKSFLISFKEEVLSQRWHIFFVAYLRSLIQQEKYEELLRVANRYQLPQRDEEYQSRPIYIPVVHWYILVAQFIENKIDERKLIDRLVTSITPHTGNDHKMRLIDKLTDELKPIAPSIFEKIKSNPALQYSTN